MKNKICYLMFMFLLVMPIVTKAEEFKIVSEDTKYYKTITTYNEFDLHSLNCNVITKTMEITEEEYNNSNTELLPLAAGTTETTYKKMTTSILSSGNYYRYQNRLVWKNFPKIRSYDIIGIGFLSTVKMKNSATFEQYYCPENSSCVTSTTHYPQTFSNGAGTTFKLPTGTLTQLEQTYYFDVQKNTTLTINTQYAYGDYSHATSTITLANAKKYTVGTTGIVLNSSVTDYYDSINKATAVWTGTW